MLTTESSSRQIGHLIVVRNPCLLSFDPLIATFDPLFDKNKKYYLKKYLMKQINKLIITSKFYHLIEN
jgi:hypothetical protein